jgi:hypothetical protein
MINPSLYVILKLSLEFFYQKANLVKVIKDASKDLIDELYLNVNLWMTSECILLIVLLKRNPKLKKLYIQGTIKECDFKHLKFKAARLLENWVIERY